MLLFDQIPKTPKKLVLILATFTLVTEANKKDYIVLERISYIYYFFWFKKDKVKALIEFDSKINNMTLEYASKLGFKICFTNVRA